MCYRFNDIYSCSYVHLKLESKHELSYRTTRKIRTHSHCWDIIKINTIWLIKLEDHIIWRHEIGGNTNTVYRVIFCKVGINKDLYVKGKKGISNEKIKNKEEVTAEKLNDLGCREEYRIKEWCDREGKDWKFKTFQGQVSETAVEVTWY